MRPFSLNRLAYFDELANDPDVDKVIKNQSKPWILAAAEPPQGRQGEWTKEFQAIKKIGPHDHVQDVKGDLSVHTDSNRFNISDARRWTPQYYEFFYNPELNLLLVHHLKAHTGVNIPAVLDYLGKLEPEDIGKLEGKKLPPELLR